MTSKIVVMYRLKNEERWIKQSIESIYDLCDEIVVLDDNSTDNTKTICSQFDKVVDIHTKTDSTFDEARDRNFLLDMALKRNPDILLSLDGDEIFLPNSSKIIQEEIDILHPEAQVFEFQFLTLWDSSNQIRFDGAFSSHWQKRMFRLKDQPNDLKINDSPYPRNLHCGSIPTNTIGIENPVRSNAKIFHCASFDESLRKTTHAWYVSHDPDNPLTDNYQHLLNAKGRFSGSALKFQTIPSDLSYDLN
ncbi:glycoprotein 3-alpha-L-fucosyltransferase [Marine Group I thaumarchaeote SCGC AAA799-P11]|uniref:Glycoprotein 3-alpha-L-fucosyltransferase n=1 Tax=Marine Group I thaumarchaeote SCGC AAA799-P11 TaxID=1502295 RepID=A0A087S2X2_9ARCH|nr:glycoprotein 3-alpha-L-fucosyltransferase [Marine Group I thaumarchaeote SCGC AAA799-P11]